MRVIFTICSNNYLHQAQTLGKSVKMNCSNSKFYIGLADELDERINYAEIDAEIIPIKSIEPTVNYLIQKYNIIEFNTAIKPRYFEYFLHETEANEITYLDPDVCLFGDPNDVTSQYSDAEIFLTPHILTPIPFDDKKPDEPLFLNYGLYNLGFIHIKKGSHSVKLIDWWKQRTYKKGYDNPAIGLFTDQLWMNLTPLLFSRVHILTHMGLNMAPWNLHERALTSVDGKFVVNSDQPLIFYHFSGFAINEWKLHKDYNRFTFNNRPDIIALYTEYKNRLDHHQRTFFTNIQWSFQKIKDQYQLLMDEQIAIQRKDIYKNLTYIQKVKSKMKSFLMSRIQS
jgi:hypothetical protein